MADDKLKLRAQEVADRVMVKIENQLFGSGLDRVKVKHEIAEGATAFAAELAAEARVEEAKHWHRFVGMAYMCEEHEMRTETYNRIAELEATLASLRTPQTEGGR